MLRQCFTHEKDNSDDGDGLLYHKLAHCRRVVSAWKLYEKYIRYCKEQKLDRQAKPLYTTLVITITTRVFTSFIHFIKIYVTSTINNI